jgi:aminoglycoside phosphotransferase (APT) family kinase protein
MSALARDPQATAESLQRWLTSVAGLDDVAVTDLSIPGATGWSNETILFDATWRRPSEGEAGGDGDGASEAAVHELVARIAPIDHTVFPDQTFSAQYHVMRFLADHSDVPMARIHWLETSAEWFGNQFWIMDRVAGDVPADVPPYASGGWLHDAPPDRQAQAWWGGIEAMATVHHLTPDAVDLPATPVPAGADPLRAQLDLYQRFLAWAEDGRAHPGARRALDVLRRTAPPPPESGPTLTWGDARFSNLIYRDFEVVAVLDWEMAGVADPLLDLGWWLFADDTLTHGSGCQRLAGFPGRDETAAGWQELTGRSTAELGYYELLAGLRFTVIMLRMGRLLCDIGLVDDGFAYDNLVSQALAAQLD